MSGWRLTRRATPPLPVDMSPLSGSWKDGTIDMMQSLPLRMGGQLVPLGEWFDCTRVAAKDVAVEGDVTVEGCDRLRRLGAGWHDGVLRILGHGGDDLAAGMTGGKILVDGDCGDFAATGMGGGQLIIEGNCGDNLAAPMAGEREGMKEGVIVVRGNVGIRAGENLRRGLMIIGGDVGDFCGAFMNAGTIVVAGANGRYPGYGMRRGTLLLLDPRAFQQLSPASFRDSGDHDLPFFRMLERTIIRHAKHIDPARIQACRRRFCGDFAIAGKGEIFVPSLHQ